MNGHDYPPSPDYYEAPDLIKVDGQRVRLNVHHVIDAWRLDYWLGSAVAHILRAGRKPGETERAAISNAWGTLIGWFRSAEWSLPVGRLETDALRAENARLRAELAALRAPLESDAPTTINSYTGDTSVASGPCPVAAALRPANIKGEWTPRPVEPAASVDEWTDDPFAGLLSVETDEQLREWLTDRHGAPEDDQLDMGIGAVTQQRWRSEDRRLVAATWFYDGRQVWKLYREGLPVPGNFAAREAAHTLHRILTGGAA
jgi:hypothetical protein